MCYWLRTSRAFSTPITKACVSASVYKDIYDVCHFVFLRFVFWLTTRTTAKVSERTNRHMPGRTRWYNFYPCTPTLRATNTASETGGRTDRQTKDRIMPIADHTVRPATMIKKDDSFWGIISTNVLPIRNSRACCIFVRQTFHYSSSAQLAMQSAVLAIVNPSVRPSVCLSHADTVSIWLMLRSWGLH